ncbi:MAG: hypothetical protein J6E45_01805 [Prevotella sp.]|nr:hypothetical protein [Prevotella sp.]
MSRSTFSILFYANKSKLKNGIVPIMGRVTINGTQSQFSCKQSIPLDLWDVKDNHARELNRTNEQHQQEVGNLKRILNRVYRWFPSFKRFLNMERECLQYGFNEEQTDKLMHGHTINYSGWLHSNEYRRNALADNVSTRVIRDEKRNLFLHINQTPIAQWFKEQFRIGQSESQSKGIRR